MIRSFFTTHIVLLLGMLCLCGCSSDQKTSTEAETAAGNEAGVLTLYNWELYVSPDILEEFEKTTGIKVILVNYEDEEIFVGGLLSGRHQDADLAVVSLSIMRDLDAARMLLPMQPSRIPNIKHIGTLPPSLHLPGGQLSAIPYTWGTVGIMVNTKYISQAYDTWELLWDERYAGKIGMLKSAIEVINTGCKSLGYSVNTLNEAHLEKVRLKLLQQRPLLKGYLDSISITEQIASGELWAGIAYNGDAMDLAQNNPDIAYAVPREGSTIWYDLFIIPRDAPNAEAAMEFINFIHEPQRMARNAEYIMYAPMNSSALEYLPKEMLANPAIFPPKETLERCEMLSISNPTAMRQRMAIWAELHSEE